MAETTRDLQFDRAEPAAPAPEGLRCAGCQEPITTWYWQVNGGVACERCRGLVQAELRERRPARFFLASFFGLAAAAAGSGLYYAVAALTGYEFGLIGIVVGFAVGLAVKKGSAARGGWLYQGLAMVLTYLAIVSTYVPAVVRGIEKGTREATSANAPATQPAAPGGAASPDAGGAGKAEPSQAPAAERPRPTRAELFFGLLFFAGLVLALPFLAGLENLMGIAIIGFALYEAWKVNRRIAFEVSGPYDASARQAAGTAAG